MLREMAREPDELLRERDHLAHDAIRGVEAAFAQPLLECVAVVPPRHGFGEEVDLVEREAEGLADIS